LKDNINENDDLKEQLKSKGSENQSLQENINEIEQINLKLKEENDQLRKQLKTNFFIFLYFIEYIFLIFFNRSLT
jgi:predicted nuclease with TOPRIM domain